MRSPTTTTIINNALSSSHSTDVPSTTPLPSPCNENSSSKLCSEDERSGSSHQPLAVPLIIVIVGVVVALIFVVLVSIILILVYLLREAKHKKTADLHRPNDRYSGRRSLCTFLYVEAVWFTYIVRSMLDVCSL